MRHAERRAQRIADAVAGAHGDARLRRRDRLPHAELRLHAGLEAFRVRLDARQRSVQQFQTLQRRCLGREVRLRIAVALAGVIDGADAGRVQQPERRIERRFRVEDHRARRHQAVVERLLRVGRRQRNAGRALELGGRQRRGDRDHADGIGRQADRCGRARAVDAVAVRLHRLDRVEAEPEAQQHRLGRVDHRAAADRDQQIRLRRPRRVGAGNDVLARGMRRDPRIGADVTVTQRMHRPLQRSVFQLRQRACRGDEHALGSNAVRFRDERVGEWRPEDDLIDRLHGKAAGLNGGWDRGGHGVGSFSRHCAIQNAPTHTRMQ